MIKNIETQGWSPWATGLLGVAVVGLVASLFFAHIFLPFVLASLLVLCVTLGIHLYRLYHPSASLDSLFVVLFIFGFGVIKTWIPGVAIWETVLFYSCGWALLSATTLLVERRKMSL